MTSKQIMDSLYIVPALLDFMEKPSIESARVLGTYGINKTKVEEMRKLKPLLEYHNNIIQNSFKDAGYYPLLREGLKAYFNLHLKNIWQVLGIVDTCYDLLDYGAGAGQYSDQFLADNMGGTITMVDKERTRPDIVQVDFEENASWYNSEQYFEKFDLVLLAEVLHCKDKQWQEYLIQTSRLLLKTGGSLIIVENVDYAMAYRISKIKNEARPTLDEKDIESLIDAQQNRFKLVKKAQIEAHKIYQYEKIQ